MQRRTRYILRMTPPQNPNGETNGMPDPIPIYHVLQYISSPPPYPMESDIR